MTASTVSRGGIWKTPKPSCGIVWPSLSSMLGTAVMSALIPEESRELLRRAKSRLDRLDFYPEPVDLRGVRVLVVPWLFKVPGFRRFRGYATRHLVLVKGPALDEDLIVHELCHVWQLQHRPLRVWLSYARPSTFSRDRTRYRANRYEIEARAAARR